MAMINVSEKEFEAVAGAAIAAQKRGRPLEALQLDKLARKISAALSIANCSRLPGARTRRSHRNPFSWRDVPSVLDSPTKE